MVDIGLLVPIAALVALFGVIALGFRSFMVGRALRRLEEQLQQGGGSAADASLERVRQLQARAALSTGTPSPARSITLGLVTIAVLAIIGVGGWFVLGRDGGASSPEPPAAEENQSSGSGDDEPALLAGEGDPASPTPGGGDLENPPPLVDKGQYTVAIYNATNVNGAAGDITAPRVEFFGYTVGPIGDSPDSRQDLERSVVMWPEGKEDVALNVANDLGVTVTSPLDGAFTESEVGSADAIVFVGFDLAG